MPRCRREARPNTALEREPLSYRVRRLEEYTLKVWDVVLDRDFADWPREQTPRVRQRILASAELLRAFGPHLGRPHVERVEGASHVNMKELRVQIGGDPWRVFFAFDPRRAAFLLVGATRPGTSGLTT